VVQTVFYTDKAKLRRQGLQEQIFDPVRKKWIELTPEEWVRQNFILYLHHHLNYPYAVMAVEKQLLLNGKKGRFDIVVYKNAQPCIAVECKAGNITLSHGVIQQLLAYNTALKVPFLVITNGSETVAWEVSNYTATLIAQLPAFI
jgi:hypothetical protein